MTEMRTMELTDEEIHLLREALDSHEYWQLSETRQRNDGYSTVEDGANAEIDAVRALETKLWRITESTSGDQQPPRRTADPPGHGAVRLRLPVLRPFRDPAHVPGVRALH